MAKINKVLAYAEVLPSGQKTTAAIIEYDCDILNTAVLIDAYVAEDRTITRAYVNSKPEKAIDGCDGKYVILELSPEDEKAATVNSGPPKTMPGGPPKDRKPELGKEHPGPGPGGHSPKMVHHTPQVVIRQIQSILAHDGITLPPSQRIVSDGAIQAVVDDFKQFMYGDIPYNLFIPVDYDTQKSYPLVMFLHMQFL